MSTWLLPTVAVLALSFPTVSAATPVHTSQAVLTTTSSLRPFIFDGRRWTCEGAICVGRSASSPVSQPAGRECRRFVRRVGAVVAYRQNGYVLTREELAQCNAALAGT